MNQILANIYGTGGHEKVAHAEDGTRLPQDLNELSLFLVTGESTTDAEGFQKVASAHKEVLDDLVAADQAGRAMAHHEFSEMEKQAAEGDPSALEAFFSDVLEETDADIDDLRAELKARLNG